MSRGGKEGITAEWKDMTKDKKAKILSTYCHLPLDTVVVHCIQ